MNKKKLSVPYICSNCGSDKTMTQSHKTKKGNVVITNVWHTHHNTYVCHSCHHKLKYEDIKRASRELFNFKLIN